MKRFSSFHKSFGKKILSVVCFAFIFSVSKGQYVNIPDANFRFWLMNNGYSGCIVGNSLDTTCPAVLNATLINFSNTHSISDLSGIQYFHNLDTLDCNFNQLTSFPSLPESLKFLDCSYNYFTLLPPLPSSLNHFRCDRNLLTSLPNLPTSLTYLHCGQNHLISLPILPLALTYLNCQRNNLTSIPTLPASLDYLACGYNPLNVLPGLPNQLTSLWCDSTQLASLPNLPDSLHYLSCSYNQISLLPNLPTKLMELYCVFNQLTALPNLPNSLNELECTSNLLTSLPNFPTSLYYLDCSSNQIISLPGFLDSLNYLDISINPIYCLPEIKKISSFHWANTNIHCIPNYGAIYNSFPSISNLSLCQPSSGCPTFWNITGNVFLDSNNNCLSDTNEIVLKNIPINLDSGSTHIQTFFTNNEGNYSFRTGLGNYKLQIDTTNLPFNIICPASFFNTSILNTVDSLDSLANFGVQCKPGFDLKAGSISPNGMFGLGRRRTLNLYAGDAANFYGLQCFNVSGIVQALISGPVFYVSPANIALLPSSINGDTILWNISDFSLVNPFTDFNIIVQVSTTATTSDSVCIQLNVSPVAGDNIPSNNFLSACFPIRNAVDPNEKYMSPSGAVDTSQQWFTFTVFFQNTGNAPAEEIYILDTLNNNLDPTTFTFLSSSHYVITQMLPGNVLRFNYPNVNLPDSNSNEAGSHGYVQYKVKRKSGLPIGTVITNTAYIYFDFNSAVVTNQTSATLEITTGIHEAGVLQFELYPNPSSSSFIIQTNEQVNSVKAEAFIYDLIGKNVYQQKLISTKTEIAKGVLERGVYFVKVIQGENQLVKKMVIQQ